MPKASDIAHELGATAAALANTCAGGIERIEVNCKKDDILKPTRLDFPAGCMGGIWVVVLA
jgi:hypothetical protein